MDLNEQVARRRAELQQQEKQAKADLHAADAASKAAEQARREAAVDDIAADLAASGVPVRRDGEDLAIEHEAPQPVNIEGMRRSKLNRLIKREARLLWTPDDNWLVISLIVAGITLIHLAGIGLIPLGIGLWRRSALEKRYIAQVLSRYPQLKPA